MAVLALAGILLQVAGAQPAKTFSHRVHLKLKLECLSCHVSVGSSTRVADNNLPSIDACRSCHTDAVTIKRPFPTLLATFNHRLHIKLGNVAPVIAAAIDAKSYLSPAGDIRRHLNTTNACQACHRGLQESDSVNKTALPRMADCLVCHNKIDPPFTCEQCHVVGAHLKPANHVTGFMDVHSRKSAGLDKTSCAVCHGRRFTCQGCH